MEGGGVRGGPSASTMGSATGAGSMVCWGTAVVKVGPGGRGRGTLGRNSRASSFFGAVNLAGDAVTIVFGPVGNCAGAGADCMFGCFRTALGSSKGGSVVFGPF